MPIASLSSKWQITIPKIIRKALNLKKSEKVLITVENDRAIIKPLKGNILDIGGSIKIPKEDMPIDFKKTRMKVEEEISKRSASTSKTA